MNLSKLKFLDKVEIEWHDAEVPLENRWRTPKELNDWAVDPIIFKEIGYFWKKLSSHIILITGFSAKNKVVNEVCGAQAIPLGSIRSVKILK